MSFRKEISKDEIKLLPLLKYEGKVVVIEREDAVERAIEEIMKADMVGFDTESRPSFKKGIINPVAMLQVALEDVVYIIRVSHCGFTSSVVDLLQSGNVLKIGISLDDDFLQLQRSVNVVPHNFIDLNKLAPQNGIDNIGVRNLSGIFLEGRVSKNQQTSNWEAHKLTKAQITYAATDAWVCLKIYQQMMLNGIR